MRAKSGSLVDVEFVSKVYPVGGEKVIQCTIRDITERKQVQDAWLKSQALLREQSVRDHLTGLFNQLWIYDWDSLFHPLYFYPCLSNLIFKSGYFPKILGVLSMIAAFGYLIDGFSHVLIANYKTGPVSSALLIAIAETAFPSWLLIKGVNAYEWERRAVESASLVPMPIG